MDIHVHCSNGHLVQAHEYLAGRKIACPQCQTQVDVPRPAGVVTDTGVLRLLEEPDTAPAARPAARASKETQVCPRCNKSLPADTRICDHCQLYLVPNSDTWNSVFRAALKGMHKRRRPWSA